MNKFKKIFISGLLALLPVVATIYVFYLLLSVMDGFFGNLINNTFKTSIPGVGIAASLILILICGIVVTNVIGSKLWSFVEGILKKIPVVPKIYFGIKQIIQAFSSEGKQIFSKVALVEYPRKGCYAIGFVTGQAKGEIQNRIATKLINVYVPTTPTPTAGILLLVPEDEVINLDMTVEEGLKLVISAGVVVPELKDKQTLIK